jgi:hypothetical protein
MTTLLYFVLAFPTLLMGKGVAYWANNSRIFHSAISFENQDFNIVGDVEFGIEIRGIGKESVNVTVTICLVLVKV